MVSSSVVFKQVVGAALATLAFTASAAPRYTITEITAPSGEQVNVWGMNDKGQLTGSLSSNTGPDRAFVTEANGLGLKTLTMPGNGHSQGFGINSHGEVVGQFFEFNVPNSMRAFIATADGVQFTPLPPGYQASAKSVNEGGRIVGYQLLPGDGYYHEAILGNARNGVRAMPGVYGDITDLKDINAGGGIVGTGINTNNYSAHVIAGDGNGLIDLGTLGGDDATGSAINDYGMLTGGAEAADDVMHVVTGSVSAGLIDLGLPAGASSAVGQDINNAGVITGNFYIGNESNAFVHTAADGFLDLNLQLDQPGLGWNLRNAVAINNLGQITGQGVYQGRWAAYLLTPLSTAPEPQAVALCLAGLGTLTMASQRRRRKSAAVAATAA